MTGIQISVLWHSDQSRALQDAELEIDDSLYEHRFVTIYRLDAISPNRSYGKEYTNLHFSGDSMIAPISYDEMRKYLKDITL